MGRKKQPRAVRIWLAGLVWLFPALAVGLVTASVEHPFGPHQAVYQVTVDSQITIDLGPLGQGIMATPLPGPLSYLGAHVEVGPIPEDLMTAGSSRVPDGLPDVARLLGDLEQYGQAYLGIGVTIRHAVDRLLTDAAIRAGLTWGLAVFGMTLIRLALGRARRNQIGFWLDRHRAAAGWTVTMTAVALVGASALAVVAQRPPDWDQGDPVLAETPLAGTPLEGLRLTGRLGQLLSLYGRIALNAYHQTEEFYSQAASSVELAFERQAEAARSRGAAGDQAATNAERADELGSPRSLVGGQVASDGDDAARLASPESLVGGQPATNGDDADPQASPDGPVGGLGGIGQTNQTATSRPPDEPWLTGTEPYGALWPALFFSDLHCNVGMAQVLGAAARGSGARLVLDGGDTTMDGTTVERYCIDVVADAIPDGVPWVVASGNHDTAATRRQEHQAGAVVLDGSVVEVAGLRLLGDADPTHTELGSGTALTGQETLDQVATRLSRAACDHQPRPDLLLVHNPGIAQLVLEGGCVPAGVAGHMHTRSNPRLIGGGVRYTQSSTGRDTANGTMVGPLDGPAELTIMLFDQSNRWVGWQLITVYPDASAKLSPVKPVPIPPQADPGGRSEAPLPPGVV
ncbi:MAG: metallophosphoesterase [Bifidobacteriaceae bacterium]|nr:metallophosphoesterase [Bifidobacteriaceae bacterium]